MALLFLFSLVELRAHAQGNESDIKAMFLYNFIKYVEWPASGSTTFRIGVAGETPVNASLRKVAEQKRVNGKALEVVAIGPGQWPDVLMVFVTDDSSLDEVIGHYGSRAVLVVTEVRKKMPKGSMINLVNRDNKIRFELNIAEARDHNLRISSQLANLAEHVIQ
jgi:hypothetical protein